MQTIVALDRATPETTEWFHQPDFEHWERWVMEEGDLGRVSHDLLSRAAERYIAFLDADNLFGENWLAAGWPTRSGAVSGASR